MEIKEYTAADISDMVEIWNGVVAEGNAFPQTELLTEETARDFFAAQTVCGVAKNGSETLGLYILHPNNIGRCSHIANASYAVSPSERGFGVGEKLVSDSLKRAKDRGFRILQFNAVVSSNTVAHNLYKKLKFTPLGTVTGGFLNKDGAYEDICLYFKEL